jgi:quercetin dioxygenase-like cupin family protein
MSLNFTAYDNPPEYGVHYLIDKAGEGIMMHSHLYPETWHFTRVLKGSIHVYGDGIDALAKAGSEFHFPSYRYHEVIALEDSTEILNILLGGKPASLVSVKPSDLSGAYASVVMGPIVFRDW